MADQEFTYVLRIEGVRPHEFSLDRLIDYLRAVQDLIGGAEALHLVDVKEASTGPVLLVDRNYREQAEARLSLVRAGSGPVKAQKAFEQLRALAENDNYPVRLVRFDGTEAFHITPRRSVSEEDIGPIRRDGFLQGHVVGVVGQDRTKHIRLQDGDRLYTGIIAKEKLAAELGHHLFIPTVRLIGHGLWTRRAAVGWELDRFTAESFEVLDDRPFLDVVRELRSLHASDWHKGSSPWDELNQLREDA